jgi:hypothetical protein
LSPSLKEIGASIWNAVPKVTQKITNPETPDLMGNWRRRYKYKTKFGMLGPVAAGKSTIAATLVHDCQTLSATQPNFYIRVLPDSSEILSDANKLRLGKFPEKTDPLKPKAPQAGLLISQHGMLSNTGVHVPICDVAGEITDYLSVEGDGNMPYEKIRSRIGSINYQVVDTVKECQGFIIALDSNDALMFNDGTKNDNDVYMHSALTNILEWRRRNNKPDPYVIVVLTKWDQVMMMAKDLNMNVYDGEVGLQRFLDNGFPSLSTLLKPLRDKGQVKFFRSWFKLAQDPNTKEPLYWDAEKLKPKIEIVEDDRDYIRFKPKHSEPDYFDLIKYISDFGG